MLLDLAAEGRCVLVRLNCVHAVIWHRTNDTAERPGHEREQSDGATQAAAGHDSICAQAGHAGIIRVHRCRVKAAFHQGNRGLCGLIGLPNSRSKPGCAPFAPTLYWQPRKSPVPPSASSKTQNLTQQSL